MGWNASDALRRNNFDVLRCLLAALVILSHSWPLATGLEATEPLRRATLGQLSMGELAVDWFFVISGFLITHSLLRARSLRDFFRKRALRLYPGFAVATLFGALLVAPLSTLAPGDLLRPRQLFELVWATLSLRAYHLPGVFAANPWPGTINGSMWSIRYEVWCYVGVAVLGLIGLLRHRAVVATLFAASLAVSLIFLAFDLHISGSWLGLLFGYPPFWARLAPYYLAGVVFYLFRERIPFGHGLALASVVALLIGARLPGGIAVALPTAGTYLLFWLVFHPTVRLHDWARYGDFSYGIYLYAFPVQQLLVQYGPGLSPLGLAASALPITVGLAVFSWFAVERGFLVRSHATVAAAPAAVCV